MKAQLVLLLVLFLGFAPIAKAQDFEVPHNYTLVTNSDYEKYQPQLIKAIDWFENTAYDQERIKKREVATFIMDWIKGYRFVTVQTSDNINELGNKDHDLLVMYIAGYARYALQS